jgi:hypothetical protein
MASAIEPAPIAEALPVEVLMREIAPLLSIHVDPVEACFAP